MSEEKNNEQTRELINAGADITGGAIGGAISFFADGPFGAAALGVGGILASKTLSHLGGELSKRLLGPRELTRIGATLALAAQEISERIKNGETIRSDGFFDSNELGRSKADELAESVLLKSQREPEEKKIPLLAHLLANVSFRPEISVSLGEQMIKVADSLTYRQLCILRLSAAKNGNLLRKTDYREQGNFTRDLYQLLHECFDLYNRGFISFGNNAVLGMTEINPSQMTIQGLGVDIYNWMELSQIPTSDLTPISDVLSV